MDCVALFCRTLENNQLQLPLITVQWFMCLFVNTLRPEVTLRIWDMFLNEGSKVLFRIAAALFKVHEKELLEVKDAGDLFTTLRRIGKDVVDADVLIAAAYKSYQPSNPSAKVLSASASSVSSSTSSKSAPVKSNAQRLSVSAKLPAAKANNAQTNNDPPSLNKPRQSPATSTVKKNPFFDISPRLHKKSDAGKVPNVLQGVGLAHVGPIAGRPDNVRYESVTDIASYVWDLAGGTISFEIDQEMMNTAKQMSDNLLSAESFESKTAAIKEKDANNSKVTTEDSKEGDEEKPEAPEHVTPPPVEVTGGDESVPSDLKVIQLEDNTIQTFPEDELPNISSHNNDSSDSFDQSLFANPSLMLNRVRESQVGRSKADFVNAVSPSSGKPKRNRRFKPGEFVFTRADIAVWRSTFRPGLQDRYERMEKARAEYVKEKEKSDLKNTPLKKPPMIDSTSGKEQPKADSSPSSPKETITPISIGKSPRMSNPAISPAVARRSLDQASLSPMIDAEALNTSATYDLDHQFEKS